MCMVDRISFYMYIGKHISVTYKIRFSVIDKNGRKKLIWFEENWLNFVIIEVQLKENANLCCSVCRMAVEFILRIFRSIIANDNYDK